MISSCVSSARPRWILFPISPACATTNAEIAGILERYAQAGVSNILSLGGDAPKGLQYRKADDHFQHAIDLVKFIRKFNESGHHPTVEDSELVSQDFRKGIQLLPTGCSRWII